MFAVAHLSEISITGGGAFDPGPGHEVAKANLPIKLPWGNYSGRIKEL